MWAQETERWTNFVLSLYRPTAERLKLARRWFYEMAGHCHFYELLLAARLYKPLKLGQGDERMYTVSTDKDSFQRPNS